MTQDDHSTRATLRNTEGALEAIRRGFQPIPLVSGDKKAKIPGWPRLRWENTPEGLEDARQRFDQWAEEGHGGLGVLLGKPSGDLVDIDLDHPSAMRLRDHFLPPTRMRSGHGARPGSHYWYIAAPGTLQESRTFKLPKTEDPGKQMLVEYRSTGGQTALPGNVHPSGEAYTWAGEPWGGAEGPRVVDGRMLLVQTALLGFCSLLVNYWPNEGGRHEAYLALAGGLLRVGDGVHPYWSRNIGVVISAIADATHDDDGAETRIEEAVSSTRRRLLEGRPSSGFNKLAQIIGEEPVKQARVILAEIESAAGLPSRTSGELSIERIERAVDHPAPEGSTAPATAPSAPVERPAAPEAPAATRDEFRERVGLSSAPEEGEDETAPNVDPLESRRGTWDALDLEPYLTGQVQKVYPSVLERTDGQALLYPGRLNMLYGPSEAAKSWIAMYTCTQVLERGERVIYLDFEDEPVNALERMQLLGASYDDLRTNFRYVRPEEPLAAMQRSRWGDDRATEAGQAAEALFQELLDTHDPALIVADGMTVLYGLHGLDSNDSVQTDIITSWLKRLSRNGRSTVIVIDHTAKSPVRGSLPIGSQHKVAMVQGTLLQTYPVKQPMPGAVGEVELLVLKDRPGQVRAASEKSGEKAQLAAKVIMDSTVPGTTSMAVEAPKSAGPAAQGAPTRSQEEIDLEHARAAERAERMQREEAAVLALYGGEIGKVLTKAEMALRLYGVDRVSALPKLEARTLNRTVERLLNVGWIEKVGDTRGMGYVLRVADADGED